MCVGICYYERNMNKKFKKTTPRTSNDHIWTSTHENECTQNKRKRKEKE